MSLKKHIQPSITTEVLDQLVKHYHSQLTEEAKLYLEERAINQETINQFLIGYEKDQIGFQANISDFSGYFHNRIIFPLTSLVGETVDLVGRSLDGKEPKYKTLIGINDVFFNEKSLKAAEDVVICNSIFDVLSLEQANISSVCTINNQWTESQISKLQGKRVFLCFGNDENGRREGIRVSKILAQYVKEVYTIHLPEGLRDLNDFFIRVKNPLDEFIKLINHTLKNSISSPISPDNDYLINFQEEYTKRHNGILSGLKTGITALDDLLIGGLQEGLYLLGGDVSVGKTSFLKQLADQLAETVPVIFVSFDMTSFELWVRSMSRLTGHSTNKILAGEIPLPEIQKINQRYADIAQNIWTIDADINTTLEDIAVYLNKILQKINKKPVIILDYLQRIHLSKDVNLPAKDLQLQIAYNLHKWSRQWGIPILLATTGTEKEILTDILATVDVFLSLNKETVENQVTLKISKNRNGNLGNFHLSFDHQTGYFSEISKNTD